MKLFNYNSLIICTLLSIICSCKTNLLVLEDLVPTAKQRDMDLKFEQRSLTNYGLRLKIAYEFNNPYKRDLPIPDHAMGLIFNDDEKPKTLVSKKSIIVPPNSTEIVDYEFELDFNTLASLMGKVNKVTFHTSIELDLSDFSDFLPSYQLNVSDDFDFETSELKPIVDDLLKRRIGPYNLVLERSANIKIPAIPTITPAAKPIEITLLGDGIKIPNLNDVKDNLVPFTDMLINDELTNLTHPFITSVKELQSPIPPNPTLESIMLNAINIVFQDRDFTQDWINLTGVVAPANGSIDASTYLLSNFLNADHLSNFTNSMWNNFITAYDSIKNVNFPDLIPGPGTRGFEISIPISFFNNNEFPLTLPVFRSSVFMTANNQPFSMYVRPEGMNEVPLNSIPTSFINVSKKSEKTLFIVFSFDMQAFNQGMYSLFMKNQFDPNLKGIMSFDFGYRPMFIGYDLDDLELNYK